MFGNEKTLETTQLLGTASSHIITPTTKLILTIFVSVAVGFGAGMIVWGLSPKVNDADIPPSPCKPPTNGAEAKNLVFMVGDGFGPSAVTLTRTMLNRTLSFDNHLIGTVKTYSASSYVTDSAAAATAYGCGVKTHNGWCGVTPEGVAVGSIMEAAIASGKSGAIVATCPVYAAILASFSSHSVDRDLTGFVAWQQIQQKIDLFLGGGMDQFTADDNFLLNMSLALGYNVIQNKSQLENAEMPLLGLFSGGDFAFLIDKEPDSTEPSLSEMTEAALRILSGNPNGFMLLIEGSAIDHAEHANDPATAALEAIEFEKTFQVVIDFAEARGDTLVLSTADHETGGLTLGKDGLYAWYPDVLKAVTKSSYYIANVIDSSPIEMAGTIFENFTSLNISSSEVDQLRAARNTSNLQYVVNEIVSDRARIGWTTLGHTGVDVNLYGYGPEIYKFCGSNNNIELNQKILSIFGWDLEPITYKLRNFDTSGNNYTSQTFPL